MSLLKTIKDKDIAIKEFWALNFNNFIILENKQPTHQLTKPKKWKDVVDCDNIGVLIPEPYIVLDVDNEVDALAYSNYIKETGGRVFQVKTTRGIHFWFKGFNPIKNLIHKPNPLGIICDVRSYGKLSYVVIRKDGKWREILTPEIRDLSELRWISHYDIPRTNKLLIEAGATAGLKEGDGRRDVLFNRIIPLAKDGYSKKDVVDIFRKINKYIFSEPLDESEFANMFTDETIWKTFESGKPYWVLNDKGVPKWVHDEFALYIHRRNYGIKKDNLYWMFIDDKYQTGKILLDEVMINEWKQIKQNQRNEVRTFLQALPSKFNNEVVEDPYMVGVQNGLLNIESGELIEVTPKYFIQTHLNVNYNPDIPTKYVDKILLDLANGDLGVKNLLEEVMGYTLLRDQRFQVAFIAVGEGSNGKSLWLKMIMEMLGHDNVSAIDYTQVTEKFKIATLLGKCLNVGEEMPNRLTKNPEIFKKLITGDPVQAEFKNENTFVLRNTAKFIFTANELPPTSDRSHGFYRRWVIIPFTNTFTNENRDTTLENKIKTDDFKSAVLNIAIRGLKRLLTQNGFTHCDVVDKMMNNYQIENNTVLRFLREEIIYSKNIADIGVMEVYKNYKNFCSIDGFMNLSSPKFIKEVLKEFNDLEIRISRINGIDMKVFKEKPVKNDNWELDI